MQWTVAQRRKGQPHDKLTVLGGRQGAGTEQLTPQLMFEILDSLPWDWGATATEQVLA